MENQLKETQDLALTITEKAAEKILAQLDQESLDKGSYGLRIQVKAGGCSGMTYVMDWDQPTEVDQVFTSGEARVIVDAQSISFVGGSVLDFVEALTGAGFTLTNPNATGTCGCGVSFSI